jgi:hypothetical protein
MICFGPGSGLSATLASCMTGFAGTDEGTVGGSGLKTFLRSMLSAMRGGSGAGFACALGAPSALISQETPPAKPPAKTAVTTT